MAVCAVEVEEQCVVVGIEQCVGLLAQYAGVGGILFLGPGKALLVFFAPDFEAGVFDEPVVAAVFVTLEFLVEGVVACYIAVEFSLETFASGIVDIVGCFGLFDGLGHGGEAVLQLFEGVLETLAVEEQCFGLPVCLNLSGSHGSLFSGSLEFGGEAILYGLVAVLVEVLLVGFAESLHIFGKARKIVAEGSDEAGVEEIGNVVARSGNLAFESDEGGVRCLFHSDECGVRCLSSTI